MPRFKDKTATPLSATTTFREKPPANAHMASKAPRMIFKRRVREADLSIFRRNTK